MKDHIVGRLTSKLDDKVASMVAEEKKLFFLYLADMLLHNAHGGQQGGRHGGRHGGRQGGRPGGRQGGWSRVLVDWAQTFSTRTLPDLRVF